MIKPMRRDARIAIIGGSLVGPLAELLFRREGFTNVTTFEAARAARPQSGGIIGIQEWNAKVINSVGVPTEEITAYPGAEVTTYDLKNARVERMRDTRMYEGVNSAWDLFHHAVASRVNIRYGHKATGIRPSPGGAVVEFANGTAAEFDLVIFADGRKSTGRALLCKSRNLTYTGYVLWRGLREHIGRTPVGFERYRDDAAGVLFSVTEPIRRGNHTGESDWTLYHNLSEAEYARMAGALPSERAFMLPTHMTPRAHHIMCTVAARYLPERFSEMVQTTRQIMAVPMNDVPFPKRAAFPVGTGYAVLVSDALVSVRPHAARGVNNGIEQVSALARSLADGSEVQASLGAWEETILAPLPEWIDLGVARAQRNRLGVDTV
ncbi:hypothetical protein ACFY4C_42220 [Actinomadura viridis]|uniref:hypothetical protein n=1 Tax=Actinomadura viridis TaxID=58110 RepID=UPI0036BE1AFA